MSALLFTAVVLYLLLPGAVSNDYLGDEPIQEDELVSL